MARKTYTNLSIPTSLIKQIDTIIEKEKNGYTSRAEFVKDAIRRLLKEM